MFRLPSDAKEWYEKIPLDKKTPLFSEEWDLYYLCLLYGISEDAVDNKAERIDMAKHFTKKYKHAKDILVPLLMLNHAKKRKKRLDDKDTLQKILEKYYDPEHESNTSLSTEAINEMNDYAAGGFYLLERKVPFMSESVDAINMIYKDLSQKMDKFSKRLSAN